MLDGTLVQQGGHRRLVGWAFDSLRHRSSRASLYHLGLSDAIADPAERFGCGALLLSISRAKYLDDLLRRLAVPPQTDGVQRHLADVRVSIGQPFADSCARRGTVNSCECPNGIAPSLGRIIFVANVFDSRDSLGAHRSQVMYGPF